MDLFYVNILSLGSKVLFLDGTVSASTFYPTTTGGGVPVAYTTMFGTTWPIGTYTQSFYVKSLGTRYAQIYNDTNADFANFDLTTGTVQSVTGSAGIQNCGSGWYRIWLTTAVGSTFTNYNNACMLSDTIPSRKGGNITSTANGIAASGGQFEAGAFPTSYIPTTTAALTRSADVCQITGGDFSGFWNTNEGSFAIEYDFLQSLADVRNFPIPFQVTSSLDSNGRTAKHVLYGQNDQLANSYAVENVTNQATIDSAPMSDVRGVFRKCAMAYKANDFALSSMGAAALTDTAGSVPSGMTAMEFLADSTYGTKHSGHIARLRCFNTRLTNATLRLFSGGSGAFQPDNISGLQFWVDAADTTTLYQDSALTTRAINDGDPVGGWKNKSSLALNLTQSDSLYKPALRFTRQNGRPGVNFNLKVMKTAITTAIAYPTIFVVAKNTTYPNAAPYIFDHPTNNYYAFYTNQSDGKVITAAPTGLASSNATTLGTAFQATLKWDNPRTDSGLRLNAVSVSGNIGNNPWVGFTLGIPGHYAPSGAYKMDGDIYEILVYNSVLSNSDILLVEAYLKAKWGTP
jgi:hypothetical protein